MKRLSVLIIVVFMTGFGSVELRPTANRPGVVSTKTSIPFNRAPNGFSILKYDGFREDQLIVGRYSLDGFVTTKKNLQRRTFDSLGTGKFKVTQPPACVHLTKNLFIDEAEITNIDYQEYLFYIRRDSVKEVFDRGISKIEVYDSNHLNYFTSPEYRFFPVVGLTHDQATEYCRWRSNFVTNVYKTEYRKNVNFKFRLPTEAEWELAASNGLDKTKYEYGIENQQMITYRVNKKAIRFIFDRIQTTNDEDQVSSDIVNAGTINDLPFNVKRDVPYFLQFETPYYAYSFYRNDYEIYNMTGNVAEMIDEIGIAKGGSFRDELSNSRITARRNYDTPTDDIGFRCICEVE